MKQLLSIGCLALILLGCQPENDKNTGNPPNASSLAELKIPADFNWSSSVKGQVEVNLRHPEGYQTEGREVWLMDVEGQRVNRSFIQNDRAVFHLSMRQDDPSLFLYYPLTGDKMRLLSDGPVDFKLHFNPEQDLETILENQVSGSKFKKSIQAVQTPSTINALGNADFEINDFGFYYSTSGMVDDGRWYAADGNFTWSDENGSKVVKAKNKKTSYLYQQVSVTAGDSFEYSADAFGNAYAFLLWHSNNSNLPFGSSFASRIGNQLSLSGVVPTGADYVSVLHITSNKGWTDNAHFGTAPAVTDADGDGVADSHDDFPSDPNRAFSIDFPSGGNQTLGFEDLWPSQGDYDFNDLVITSKYSFNTDAAGQLVDADVTISLDAIGAGAHSGLGLLLLDQNKQPFPNSIISSTSSNVVADPDNPNGIIVFASAASARSEYYTNTEAGSMATPDTIRFTIQFAGNAGAATIIPDLYIFRTNDRGRETHLAGFGPSNAADPSYFNNGHDVNGTYKTANGLPWAIEVITGNGTAWNHPLEKTDILLAFPQFQQWAESAGSEKQNWYKNPDPEKIIDLSLF